MLFSMGDTANKPDDYVSEDAPEFSIHAPLDKLVNPEEAGEQSHPRYEQETVRNRWETLTTEFKKLKGKLRHKRTVYALQIGWLRTDDRPSHAIGIILVQEPNADTPDAVENLIADDTLRVYEEKTPMGKCRILALGLPPIDE